MHPHPSLRKAFTLIELLVVIAVIAILSVVVILTLNPAELLRQSRDANRVSDMDTLTHAFGIYSEDVSSGNLGSSSVVYISIPDSTATSSVGDQCQGLGLPTLPSNYSYHCTNSTYNRNVDGTGWIPVNFKSISSGAPIGSLPVDPTNNSSSRLYYTYTTNGTTYEVTTGIESSKYKIGGSNDVITGDGGFLASVYEKGTKLGLEPVDYGYSDNSLVAYWPLNEGSGTTAYDYSGNGNNGGWNGAPAGTNGYYSAGKAQSWAGAFNGTNTNTYVAIASNPILNISGALTITAWVLPTVSEPSYGGIAVHRSGGTSEDYAMVARSGGIAFNYHNGITWFDNGVSSGAATNVWHLFTVIRNSAGTTINFYIDGVLVSSLGGIGTAGTFSNTLILGADLGNVNYFTGSISNVRIYNRALSAAEIQSIYNGGK